MQAVIEKSLSRSRTYPEYRNIIAELLKEGKSTGKEQTEALRHYSELNETRMNRLEKTIKISAEYIQQLKNLNGQYIWLVLSEGWCGDAAQLLPIMHKMTEQTDKVELRIAFRDENDALMDQFLTNGSRGIPKLIILKKESLDALGDFGPRPEAAQKLIVDYKAKHGFIDETAKTNLQLWYLHDKGLSAQKEIMDLMTRIDLVVAQKPRA